MLLLTKSSIIPLGGEILSHSRLILRISRISSRSCWEGGTEWAPGELVATDNILNITRSDKDAKKSLDKSYTKKILNEGLLFASDSRSRSERSPEASQHSLSQCCISLPQKPRGIPPSLPSTGRNEQQQKHLLDSGRLRSPIRWTAVLAVATCNLHAQPEAESLQNFQDCSQAWVPINAQCTV